MERTLSFMEQAGTGAFIEFREGGVEGVRAIRTRVRLTARGVVLGRETADAMELGDGFGASGARDGEFGRASANATRPPESCSASTRASATPTTSTPRWTSNRTSSSTWSTPRRSTSNASRTARFPSSSAPVEPRHRRGRRAVRALVDRTTVALGTDNVMLNSPSMFREMEFTSKLADVSAAEVLRMATVNGADIAGLNYGLVETGRPARRWCSTGIRTISAAHRPRSGSRSSGRDGRVRGSSVRTQKRDCRDRILAILPTTDRAPEYITEYPV